MLHRLWVLVTNLPLDCDINSSNNLHRVFLRDQIIDIGEKNMGGKRKRIELASYKEWK